MIVSLSDQLNQKPRRDHRDFQAVVLCGELGKVNGEFYGPSFDDLSVKRLSVICRDMKIHEQSARLAIKRGTLKAWKSEGVWYTKPIEVKEWREKYPGYPKKVHANG